LGCAQHIPVFHFLHLRNPALRRMWNDKGFVKCKSETKTSGGDERLQRRSAFRRRPTFRVVTPDRLPNTNSGRSRKSINPELCSNCTQPFNLLKSIIYSLFLSTKNASEGLINTIVPPVADQDSDNFDHVRLLHNSAFSQKTLPAVTEGLVQHEQHPVLVPVIGDDAGAHVQNTCCLLRNSPSLRSAPST